LNGSTKKIHSHSRDGFDEGIEALRLLQNSSFSYGINWVARMDNIDDFPKMAELANNYNVNNLNILRYKPSPTEDYNACALTSEDLLENFIRKIKSVRIQR
jgi:pyrroloquinoline quinone biosynthesis protein E